jgi:hypothetical protein
LSALSDPPSDLTLLLSSLEISQQSQFTDESDSDSSQSATPSPFQHNESDEDMLDRDDYYNDIDNWSGDPEATATPRLDRRQKLDELVAMLRRLQWTFEDIVYAWVGLHSKSEVEINYQRYRTDRQRLYIIRSVIQTLALNGIR